MARVTRTDTVEVTRAWVADVVRSGLGTPEQVRAQVVEAIAQDHPDLDAAQTAQAWIEAAAEAWRGDAAGWSTPTDHDRLTAAFTELSRRRVIVLQGCQDHWAARSALDARNPDTRGIVWFLPTDVWHALDAGMLEMNLWHASGANAAPGDALLDEVIDVLAAHDLPAHFDEGRIEVTAFWRRRP